MKVRSGLLTTLTLSAGLILATASPAEAQGGCQVVVKPYSTISNDGGLTVLPYRGMPVMDFSLTWGLAATAVPGLLYRHVADAVWVSENDGCRWTEFGDTTSDLFRIAVGSGAVAYAWPENGGKFVYRLEPDGGGYIATENVAPEPAILGFAVDMANSDHVRAIGRTGQIWESYGSGAPKTWVPVGVPASPSVGLAYFGAFDPNDLDHVLYGQALDGGYVTFDGGQTWEASLFFSDPPGGSGLPPGQASDRVNFFIAVISPVSGSRVYARAVDLDESQSGDPTGGRHLYVSNDGGESYVAVIDDYIDGVPIQNQPLMTADRNDVDILRFVYSVSPLFGGTNFYTYNAATDALETRNNPIIPIVRSIAYSLSGPQRIIMGFEVRGN